MDLNRGDYIESRGQTQNGHEMQAEEHQGKDTVGGRLVVGAIKFGDYALPELV